MDPKFRVVIRCMMNHSAWRLMAFSAMVRRGGFLFAASISARAECAFDTMVDPVSDKIVIRPNVKEFPFCINFN